jgi:uncharacterized membrane protein HdeD (DUF308 family)
MKNLLHRLSDSMIISGILNLMFGAFALIWPRVTLLTLVWIFAIVMLIQGFYQLASTFLYSREKKHSWIFFLLAFINLGAGIAALLYPHVTVLFLIVLMGLTWLATGTLQILAAFRLRKEIRNEGWLVIIGLISILSGLFVLLRPGDGALALLWLIAVYAIVFGIGLLVLGFKAKKWISMDDIIMWAE